MIEQTDCCCITEKPKPRRLGRGKEKTTSRTIKMAAKQKPTKMVSPRVVVTSPKEEKVKT
jgi:hypothetical protein